MVGEGVLIECLNNVQVSSILHVGRRSSGMKHSKLSEYIVPDFITLRDDDLNLSGYDACFYCAGISSIGMKEDEYTRITYDMTLHFAKVLLKLNPDMIFNFVSSALTDSTEAGKIMWKRVKGKTENALGKMAFRDQYNFRPGLMMPDQAQVRLHAGYNKYIKLIHPIMNLFYPSCNITEVGRAMIAVAKSGFPKKTLEVPDIKAAAALG